VISSTRRTDDTPGQIHFDQGFFNGAFPAFIAFDDDCLKLDAFQFRDLSFHVSRSCGEVSLIALAVAAIAVIIILIENMN
jgi:hypothetical protein